MAGRAAAALQVGRVATAAGQRRGQRLVISSRMITAAGIRPAGPGPDVPDSRRPPRRPLSDERGRRQAVELDTTVTGTETLRPIRHGRSCRNHLDTLVGSVDTMTSSNPCGIDQAGHRRRRVGVERQLPRHRRAQPAQPLEPERRAVPGRRDDPRRCRAHSVGAMSAAVPPIATAEATGLGTGTTRCTEHAAAATRSPINSSNSAPPSERLPTINTLPISTPEFDVVDCTIDDQPGDDQPGDDQPATISPLRPRPSTPGTVGRCCSTHST